MADARVRVVAGNAFLSGYYVWDEVSSPAVYSLTENLAGAPATGYQIIEQTAGVGDFELWDNALVNQYWVATTPATEPQNCVWGAGSFGPTAPISVIGSPILAVSQNTGTTISPILGGYVNMEATITPFPPTASPIAIIVGDTQTGGDLEGLFYLASTYNGLPSYESVRQIDSGAGFIPQWSILYSYGDTDADGKSDDPFIGVNPATGKSSDLTTPGYRIVRNPTDAGAYYSPPEASGGSCVDINDPTTCGSPIGSYTPTVGSVLRVITLADLGFCYATLSTDIPVEFVADQNTYTYFNEETILTKLTQLNIQVSEKSFTSLNADAMQITRAINGIAQCKTSFLPQLLAFKHIIASTSGLTRIYIIDDGFRINPFILDGRISTLSSIVARLTASPYQLVATMQTKSIPTGALSIFANLGTSTNAEIDIFEASAPGATIGATRQNWVKRVDLQNGDASVTTVWNEGIPPSINK